MEQTSADGYKKRSSPLKLAAGILLLLAAAPLFTVASEQHGPRLPDKPTQETKIILSSSCPYPASRQIITIEPDGRVLMLYTRGFDPKADRTTRQEKALNKRDLAELHELVAKSGYESIPEYTDRSGPLKRTDACSSHLEIIVGARAKTIYYDSGYDIPKTIKGLLDGIYAILDRHEWKQQKDR